MDPHGEYHSALHVLNIAVQATADLDRAIALTEALWCILPPISTPPAQVLLILLRGAGISARRLDSAPGDQRAVVEASLRKGELLAFAVRPFGPDGPVRWCVVSGRSRTQVFYAVCAQPGDYIVADPDLIRRGSGDVVVIDLSTDSISRVVVERAADHGGTVAPN